MSIIKSILAVTALSLMLLGCVGRQSKGLASDDFILKLNVRSKPSNADLYLSIASDIPELDGFRHKFLGRTPYSGSIKIPVSIHRLKRSKDFVFLVLLMKKSYTASVTMVPLTKHIRINRTLNPSKSKR